MALISKVPSSTLAGESHEQNCDLGVFMNEMTVKIGKYKEGLNVFDLPGLRPVLIIWTLCDAIVRPSGDSIYLRYSQDVMWNSHLSARAKRPLTRSLRNTSRTWVICLGRPSK